MRTFLPIICIAGAVLAGLSQAGESRAGAIEYDFRPAHVRSTSGTEPRFLKESAKRTGYNSVRRTRSNQKASKSRGRTITPSLNDSAMNSIRNIK